MITISLCMIVKNEEAVLERCLKSVRDIADEIIIVDTGSTDGTKEIAGRYADLVCDFAWRDDFAAARNYSFSKATKEYILWLDADDVFTEKDRESFLQLKESLPSTTDIVMMKYHTAFHEDGTPSFSYYRERLIKNSGEFFWEGAIHEVIAPRGNIVYSETAVTHQKLGPGDPDRNLRIFESMLAGGAVLEPRQQFYYARELYYHGRYEDAITVFRAFLDSGKGWAENCIDACRIAAACYYALNDPDSALGMLLRSFSYDAPRAETCCDLGKHFMDRGQLRTAIFWYETAASRPRNDQSGGFVLTDCYDYIPYLQLCVCYDRLEEHETAFRYNEKAAETKPQSEAVKLNRAYFSKLLSD